jgi:hypothetical protein
VKGNPVVYKDPTGHNIFGLLALKKGADKLNDKISSEVPNAKRGINLVAEYQRQKWDPSKK